MPLNHIAFYVLSSLFSSHRPFATSLSTISTGKSLCAALMFNVCIACYAMNYLSKAAACSNCVLTCNSQRVPSCFHLSHVFMNSAGVVSVVIAIVYIHHQDVVLLDLGCPLRLNCSCIACARTCPIIAQHSGGWHSYNSAHQNHGGALLHHSSVGIGINDSCMHRERETYCTVGKLGR